ncbi:MAG: hypothetical protein U0L26_02290 [Cellulosilyticum sp.]|nr:hypothetical protein [Cellulosilyticum sp.]
MCLGKVKYNNWFGCVNFVNFELTRMGNYEIYIHFQDDGGCATIEVANIDVCEKMFNTICCKLAADGYCDIDKFNLDGDYIDVLLS